MAGNTGATVNGATERGTERAYAAEDTASGGPSSGTRRQVMRGLLAPALAVGLAPLIAASRPSGAAEAATTGPRPARPGHSGHPGPHAVESAQSAESADGAESTAFDETYRGRRIRGIRSAAGRAVGAGTWQVTVDGRPLHLMRRADGSWLSMVDHYRSYPTPLAAARGAVDELGPGEHLRDTPSTGHDQHSGGRHGVHA
ncbi:tyrosinase family oxidase copper chaperone [Streptomyces tendae]|uniref:tyrosinase family oxidase copper chaperone n=1 Tax=Streptomyces tendae TaxID=1932 RepID=UPI0033EB05B6